MNRSRVSYEENSMPPSSIKRPKSAHQTSKRKHKMTYSFGGQNTTGGGNKMVSFEAQSRKRSSSRGRKVKTASRKSHTKESPMRSTLNDHSRTTKADTFLNHTAQAPLRHSPPRVEHMNAGIGHGIENQSAQAIREQAAFRASLTPYGPASSTKK